MFSGTLTQCAWCHSWRIFGQRHQSHTHGQREGRGGRVNHRLSKKKDLRAVVFNLPNAATLRCNPSCCGTPSTIKIFSLLLHNHNVSTVINHNVDLCYEGYLICERTIQPPKRLGTSRWEPLVYIIASMLLKDTRDIGIWNSNSVQFSVCSILRILFLTGWVFWN